MFDTPRGDGTIWTKVAKVFVLVKKYAAKGLNFCSVFFVVCKGIVQ